MEVGKQEVIRAQAQLRQIANALTDSGKRATWPISRHVKQRTRQGFASK